MKILEIDKVKGYPVKISVCGKEYCIAGGFPAPDGFKFVG